MQIQSNKMTRTSLRVAQYVPTSPSRLQKQPFISVREIVRRIRKQLICIVENYHYGLNNKYVVPLWQPKNCLAHSRWISNSTIQKDTDKDKTYKHTAHTFHTKKITQIQTPPKKMFEIFLIGNRSSLKVRQIQLDHLNFFYTKHADWWCAKCYFGTN